MDRKYEKGVVGAGRLTKLPSIRGLFFASRRPAGVGLAGIASITFHHVSLPLAPRPMFLDSFPIRYTSKCSCWHAWRQVFGGHVREVKESWGTYRRTLVVSTILLGRIALLRRVAAAVARFESQSRCSYDACLALIPMGAICV